MIADRRGEAHLWLLLEEALLHVRRADVEPWEAWRNFRAVADALVVTGALPAGVGAAMVSELDDALALRGAVPAAAFTAAPWPAVEVLTAAPVRPGGRPAMVWLEAEIERHLDLFASFEPAARAWAAAGLVRILSGPVLAFRAVGLLEEAEAQVLDEVVATLAAAGVDVGVAPAPDATARPAWLDFLRARPAPLPDPHQADERRVPRLAVGRLDDVTVRIDAVAWSTHSLELEVAVRSRSTPGEHLAGAPWHARVLDDRGHLHLGQGVQLRPGLGLLHFRLRPGLTDGVDRVDVRITRGGERLEASISL